MTDLLFRVAVVSAAVSLVLLPLLLAPRWQRRYAPHTRRAVWLVIAAALLAAPLLPKSNAPVQIEAPGRTVTIPAAAPAALAGPVATGTSGPDVGAAASAAPTAPTAPTVPTVPEPQTVYTLEWGTALAVLWLTGGAAVLLWHGARCLRARRKLMKGAAPLTGYEGLAEELCPGRTVRFFQVEGLGTPLTLGALRPVVLLPGGLVRQAAVRHELIHVRRRDVAWKYLLLLACAVHWFNPLVWFMSRRADRDVEASCDAMVVAGGDAAERRAYGELLLQTASEQRIPLTTQFGGGKKLMKARLYDLFHPGKKSRVLVGVVLLTCLLAGSLVACRQTAEDALQTFRDSVRYENGVISFTIPKDYSPVEDWSVHISGRAEADGLGGISLHYLDDERWEAGKTYTLDITQEQWEDITELTMEVELLPSKVTGTRDLPADGFVIDLLALAGRSVDGVEYEVHQVALPSSLLEKNDYNAEIFEIDPFAVNLYLPVGWTVQEAAIRQQEGRETYPAAVGLFSVQCILDETGRPVGSLGYNLAPVYEETTDNPMALFAGITMADHHFDVWETFVPVVEDDGLVVAMADVVQNEGETEEIRNRGILLRDEAFGVYVAVELDSGALTEEQALDIAARLSLSAVGELADGVYCGFTTISGKVDSEHWNFSLMEYDPETGTQGRALGTYTLPLAEELTLRHMGKDTPSEAGQVGSDGRNRNVSTFLMWPLLRAQVYPGMADLLEIKVQDGAVTSLRWFQVPVTEEDAGEVQEWHWWGPDYENKKYGFTLRLPASWRNNYWADGVEDSATFYCGALPEEEGALQKLIVQNKPLTEEELTDRHRLLGQTEGCYIYLFSPEVEADTLLSWSEETRTLYQTMYDDMEALPEESLTWWNGYAARTHPITGEVTRTIEA